MMKKIDEHCYTLPKQWIADIELIARNALEYVTFIICADSLIVSQLFHKLLVILKLQEMLIIML